MAELTQRESPKFIDRDGLLKDAKDDLLPEYKAALIQHVKSCQVPLRECLDCWELYSSMGMDFYTAALVSDLYVTDGEGDYDEQC